MIYIIKKMYDSAIESLLIASNIHKKVRTELNTHLKPNIKLIDIVNIIEQKTIDLSKEYNTINKGIGFPASLSLNNCAAHFHPSNNSNISFKKDDVLKIDFGIEINGWICDSAYTVIFNEKHRNLLLGVFEAVDEGVNNIGVDVNVNEWGGTIKEVLDSYDITPIKNLGGHNILHENLHGGMFLPSIKGIVPDDIKFKEGVYAVEIFGSDNCNDKAFETNNNNLYMLKNNKIINNNLNLSDLNLLNIINTNYKTIPFTSRYIDENYHTSLNNLSKLNIINEYPPLIINSGNIAQYEHTVYINDNRKIIFSKDEDY